MHHQTAKVGGSSGGCNPRQRPWAVRTLGAAEGVLSAEGMPTGYPSRMPWSRQTSNIWQTEHAVSMHLWIYISYRSYISTIKEKGKKETHERAGERKGKWCHYIIISKMFEKLFFLKKNLSVGTGETAERVRGAGCFPRGSELGSHLATHNRI